MENRVKFIIIGLIGILAISLFIAFQNYATKETLLKEKDRLSKENESLVAKVERAMRELRVSQEKVGSVNKELDRVSQEKERIERQYELIKKREGELMERLKSQPAAALVKPTLESLPPTQDAYWAGILKAKTDLEFQLGNLRSELKNMQIRNEQLQREKSSLGLDINNLGRDNEDLKRQLEYNQKLMDSITQELVREKNDKIKIQETFKAIKNENVVLTRQLKSLNSRKVELEEKLQKLQDDKDALDRRITEIETTFSNKISKIKELKEQLDVIYSIGRQTEQPEEKSEQKGSVELPPIVVRPQTETASGVTATSLTGKILAVNRDNNFVIIDLGENSGIKVGDTFRVYRQDESIATIETIQIRKSIAACDIKKETKPIATGDTVR